MSTALSVRAQSRNHEVDFVRPSHICFAILPSVSPLQPQLRDHTSQDHFCSVYLAIPLQTATQRSRGDEGRRRLREREERLHLPVRRPEMADDGEWR